MAVLLFFLGTAIGSFLNVVVYRIGTKEKIIFDRSRCPLCLHKLAWVDLVPVVSFIFLAGRCRFCHGRISWQYPLVELLTGLLFVAVWQKFFPSPVDILFWLFFISSFIVIVLYDIKFQRIPDVVVWPLLIGGLLYNLASNPISAWQVNFIAGIGTGAAILLLVVISKERAMGMGDVPIAFLQGLLLGYPDGFIALGLSFIIGALLGIGLLAGKKATLTTAVPFTPFLIFALLLVRFVNL